MMSAIKSILSGLSDCVKVEVYDAVIEYGLSGKQPELKKKAGIAFAGIKDVMDTLGKRSAQLRANGAKGGRPPKGAENQNKPNLQIGFQTEKPSEKPENPEDSSRAHEIGNQDLFYDDKILNQEKIERELRERQKEATGFIAYFNRRMLESKALISHQCRYTTRRRDTISARKREFGKAALYQMVEKAVASDFLNGRNNRGWIATLDWLLRPNNFPKVLEGNYDNKNFNNDYGNKQQQASDRRRGFEPQAHTAAEYEEDV